MCVHTTVREANDRGYDCLVLEDCVGSYFPEFQRAALEMIKAQGGIFGWVSDSTRSSRRSASSTGSAEPRWRWSEPWTTTAELEVSEAGEWRNR